jgi:N-acylneuraminate cytidylyltransferase/CMP-N,N'-diacetyllegionaminic acid synthase
VKVLGLITARGGSKSIPKKNVVIVAGKPLIAWTIEAGLQSRSLEKVIVSTDDEEIAEVARHWGAEVPFLRPAELAQDDSPHIPVIVHAVEWLESHEGSLYEYILLLQPTSPLRSTDDIEKAVQLASANDADSVVGVCVTGSHPYLVKHIATDGRLEDFGPRPRTYLRRQALPPVYVANGAIYLVRRDVLIQQHTFYTERTYPYIMPPERSLDIDTPWDLYVVDLILKNKITHGNT